MSGYILRGHEVIPIDDFMLFAMWFEEADRKVAFDRIGHYEVSTVFLGFDHGFGRGPPVLFETMIFINDKGDMCERYCTWDEAAAGHARICEKLRESG